MRNIVGIPGGPAGGMRSGVSPDVALNAIRATNPIIPRPSGTVNIPRVFASQGPSDAQRDRAALGVAAMRRQSEMGGGVNQNIAALRNPATSTPLTEKERIAQIEGEFALKGKKVEAAGEQAIKGTFEQQVLAKEASEGRQFTHEKEIAKARDEMAKNEGMLDRASRERVQSVQADAQKYVADVGASNDATPQQMLTVVLGTKDLPPSARIQIERLLKENNEGLNSLITGGQANTATPAEGQAQATSAQATGDADNNGVPDADKEANARINFIRGYERMMKADPTAELVQNQAAAYERQKRLHAVWLANNSPQKNG